MEKNTQVIYARGTVEFTTVAAEFCAFLERSEGMKRQVFVDTLLKVLPLLYLKALLLPEAERQSDDEPETFVGETDYEVLRLTMADVMGEKDDYLEVFMPDMQYSDTPIRASVAEGLADIYQDVKDFVSVYRLGFDATMHEALVRCREHFESYWGQKLVNTLRALHDVRYNSNPDEEDESSENEWGDAL